MAKEPADWNNGWQVLSYHLKRQKELEAYHGTRDSFAPRGGLRLLPPFVERFFDRVGSCLKWTLLWAVVAAVVSVGVRMALDKIPDLARRGRDF